MAKGKNIKNSIDNELDFDDSLDFDDLDFDADPFKDDRKPATKVKDGLTKGIKSRASDPTFISGVLRELLPKGYGDTLDLGDKVATNIKQLYNEAASEVRPAIKDFKRVAAKLAPKDSKYVPDRLKKLFEKWEEEAKSEQSLASGLDVRTQRDSMISMQLGEIFKEQTIQAENNRAQDDGKDLIEEGIELNRHRDIFGVLNQSAMSLSRISQYQTTINLQYQKKSLELQHRQLFAQYDILETITKTHALHVDAYTKLIKNSGLPDWQKINLKELSSQKLFGKFSEVMGTAAKGMLPNVDEYLQMTARKIRDRTLGAIKANVQGFRSGLTEAEMAKEQAVPGMLDPYETGGEFVGEALTSTLGFKTAKRFKEPLKKAFPKVEQVGDYLENFNENLVSSAEKFRTSREWEGKEGAMAWLLRGIQSMLPSLSVDTSFNRLSGKDLNAVQPFTLKTERSINEIIPGYLSRILQEIQIIRTGNPNVDRVEYDQNKGRFTGKLKILKDIAGSVYDDKNAKRTNEILDSIIDKLDTDADEKLSDEERNTIKETFLKNKLQSKDLDRGLTGRSKELTSKYLSSLEGKDTDKLILNRQLNSLVRGMKDPRAKVERLISEGRQNELAELGIITRTDEGYSLNMDAYYKGQLGIGRYHAIHKKTKPPAIKRRIAKGPIIQSPVTNVTGMPSAQEPIVTPPPTSPSLGPQSTFSSQAGVEYTDSFNQVIERLDTSIGHYKEIIDLIKSKLSQDMKYGDRNVSLDNSVDTLFTRGKFQYQKAKVFFKKHKQKLEERMAGSGAKQEATRHYGKFKDFLRRSKPGLDAGIKASIASGKGYTGKAYAEIKDKIEKLSSVVKEDWKELYIKGEVDPRIIKAKLKAGHYVDANTGKIISKITDIKGSVRDITSDTVVLKAEEIKDLVTEKASKVKEDTASFFEKAKEKIRSKGIHTKFKDIIDKVKDKWTELYVKGERDPRIIKAKLKAGHYVDAATGKIIETLSDIKGTVKDIISGETVLKAEEIEQTYVRDKDGTFQRFNDYVKGTFDDTVSKIKSTKLGSTVIDTITKAWKGVKDTASMFKSIAFGGAKDVWVNGEKYPRMTAVKMQQGHYTDAVSGKVIYLPEDIQGEVKDEKGRTVIAADELDLLMVYNHEQKRFAPIRKLLRGIGKVFGGVTWYYNKIGIPLTKFNFRMLAKGTKFAINLAKLTMGAGPYSVKDVYVGTEPEPRLYATKMKNGEYFNKSTGRPIYHQNDINGEVVDAAGNTHIRDEDIPNLRVYNSVLGLFNPFKPMKWIAGKVTAAASWTMKQGLKITKFLTRKLGTAALGIAAGFIRYISKPEDVYVKGETEPRLRAILMKVGRYISEKTGKVISLVSDIDGPVWDQEEQIRVITEDDVKKGLVGQNGEPIKTSVMQDILTGFKKVNKLFSRRVKLNIGEALKPNTALKGKDGKDSNEPTTGEQTVSLLGDIKGMFQDFFTEKKVKGDTDGDGDREGSWEDIKAKRDALRAKQQAGKPDTQTGDKGRDKKGGLTGALSSALDAITGFLGGFKSLLKGGKVLGGLGKLLGMGRVAGTVATAIGGTGAMSAIGAGLGAIGTGIAAVVSSPVVLGVLGAAVVGYGAYKGYKALRKWMSKPTALEMIRYVQYGFKKEDISYFSKVIDLEEYLKEFVKVGGDAVEINEKKMNIEEMMSIFGFSSKDEDHKRQFGTWYVKRFKPVYLTHVSALNILNGSTDLTKINDLKKELKLKYIEAVKFSSGPYTVGTLPILDGKATASTAADVSAAIEAALKEFATTPGGAKKDSTGLPADGKKPEDIGAKGGRMDLGKPDAKGKLPGASVAGAASVGATALKNTVSAFDLVRFKTYGLKELEESKIVALTMLEMKMSKVIKFQGTRASFEGNPNELLEKVGVYFGVPDLFGEAATAWGKWFRDRFLPVYLNYATLHMQAVNKPPKADSAPVLAANQQYDVALAISSTGGAWRVTDTPWQGYELNTNPDTVKGNLEYLKDAAKQKVVQDQEAKTAQDKSAPALPKKPDSAFVARTPEYTPPATNGAARGAANGDASTASTGTPLPSRPDQAMSAGMGTGPTTGGFSGNKPDPSAKVPDPTGAGVAGLKDTIAGAAKVVGIDPNIMLTTAAIESNFNPNAKAGTSSASGLMQFIKSTWKAIIDKYGARYGYDSSTSPFDPKASAIMGAHYIKDSLTSLARTYKGAIGSVEAYLVHFMGPGGAAKFLRAMRENPGQYGSQLMPKEAAANQPIYFGKGGPRTLGEIYQLFYNKVKDKASKYGISLPASSGVDTSEKSKYVMPAAQNSAVSTTAPITSNAAPTANVAPTAGVAGQAAPSVNTAAYSPKQATTGGAVNATYNEAPKSVYNPVARPAVKQQEAVQASKQASSSPLSDAVGYNPKTAGTITEASNASKNTLTADMMVNTESLLAQSLIVHRETLGVMKMIYDKINSVKDSVPAAPKSDGRKYEAPMAPVPMRKSA